MPKVWTRFSTIHKGETIKLRIQELKNDELENLMTVWCKYFFAEEPLHKASKVIQSETALVEHKEGYTNMIHEMNCQVDVCCLDEDSNELKIVGGSIMTLEKKDDQSDYLDDKIMSVKSPEIKKLLELVQIMHNACKYFNKIDVDSCYAGLGVVVDPAYRGLGIAGELLKARELICVERNVPLTSAWMTSTGTQKAATKLGWETLCELFFQDMSKKAGVEFDNEPPSCKLMVKRV